MNRKKVWVVSPLFYLMAGVMVLMALAAWRYNKILFLIEGTVAALAVLALGGGAGWYFKIYRPKQQRAAEPEEDHADYDEPDDYDDAPPWDVDDEDEGGDE